MTSSLDYKTKERKCPSCGVVLRNFVFSAIYMPLEEKAFDFLRITGHLFRHEFIPIEGTDKNEWMKICFMSECPECGNISLWRISFDEAWAIYNQSENEMITTRIEWNYMPQYIDEIIQEYGPQKASRFAESLKKLLELASVYNPAHTPSGKLKREE